MARCPLCSSRPAKRFCPAKSEEICPVCCGTKREIEIDCPGNCVYLKSGHDYEAEKRQTDPDLIARAQRFDEHFIYRFSPMLDVISRAIVEERAQSQWLVDSDVLEVFQALIATMKTLSSGLYYDAQPEGPVRQSLFRKIKPILDQWMGPQGLGNETLKVSEALDILEFLSVAAQLRAGSRPKSRRYLDWLDAMPLPVPGESPSGLIVP